MTKLRKRLQNRNNGTEKSDKRRRRSDNAKPSNTACCVSLGNTNGYRELFFGGSFIRRYGLYAKECQDLNGYVEFTLKDDDRNDPLITKEGLEVLSILKSGEYEAIVALTKKICDVIRGELAKKGLELYDIKLEFGRVAGEEKVVLIDEISAGNMRVYKNGKTVKPLELAKLILG